jgi:polyphosphate kinase
VPWTARIRFSIPSAEVLEALARESAPASVRLSEPISRELRDTFLDSPDDALERSGSVCRVRFSGTKGTLRVESRSPLAATSAPRARREETSIPEGGRITRADPKSPAMRWLATLVDLSRLTTRFELSVTRRVRRHKTFFMAADVEVRFDTIRVKPAERGPDGEFHEVIIVATERGRASADAIARDWERRFALERASLDRRETARRVLERVNHAAVMVGAAPVAAPSSTLIDDARTLNGDLSLLEFTARVLSLAEDPRVPILERTRFVAISAANIDEFFMVRVSGLKQRASEVAEERGEEGLTAAQELTILRERVEAITTRQERAWARCRSELASSGVAIRAWEELTAAQQDALRTLVRDQVQSRLVMSSVTLAPGHPFPRVPHLTLSLAVVTRDDHQGTWHVSQLDLPREVERLVPVPASNDFILVEEAVRANIDTLYPEVGVEGVYAFRLTRAGELPVDEEGGEGTLETIAEAARRRPYNSVVRVEVERSMPWSVRRILLAELRFEPGVERYALDPRDIYESDGIVGLSALFELAALPRGDLLYPPFRGTPAFDSGRPLIDQIAERDRIVHHPYESFESSVVRLLDEAADDACVESLSITLYRAGEPSPIVDALLRAHKNGKRVFASVELQARFDEERNVGWSRRLEDGGVSVAYGVSGLKNHAKVALIERREADGLRRFVHVGSGNYNAQTARVYTDLSFFTGHEGIGRDIRALFDALAHGAAPRIGAFGACVASPFELRPAMLMRIRREIDNAHAGKPAGIRLKLNGLSDAEMVNALYGASQAGVEISLLVRGICILRPGVPDLSEHVQIVSAVGRFLEHARIYEFANAGEPEVFIGSADWRPRNLRRRVEVVVPVLDPACRARLRSLLDLEFADPAAWDLGSDGVYVQRPTRRTEPGAQDRLRAEAMNAAIASA